MKTILEKKSALLVFSLISGLAYFILIMVLISSVNYSYLLGFFFFPAIVCGAALCIIKTVGNNIENGEVKKAERIIKIHIGVIVLALLFLVFYMFLR